MSLTAHSITQEHFDSALLLIRHIHKQLHRRPQKKLYTKTGRQLTELADVINAILDDDFDETSLCPWNHCNHHQ